MAKFKVLRHFDLNGETIAVGSEVELDADQAAEFADFVAPAAEEGASTTGEENEGSGAGEGEGSNEGGEGDDDEDEEEGDEGEGEGEGESVAA